MSSRGGVPSHVPLIPVSRPGTRPLTSFRVRTRKFSCIMNVFAPRGHQSVSSTKQSPHSWWHPCLGESLAQYVVVSWKTNGWAPADRGLVCKLVPWNLLFLLRRGGKWIHNKQLLGANIVLTTWPTWPCAKFTMIPWGNLLPLCRCGDWGNRLRQDLSLDLSLQGPCHFHWTRTQRF